MPIPTLTAEELRRVCPGARAEVIAVIVASAPMVLPKYGIDTPLRVAHFLAQIAQESDGFALPNLRESMTYKSRSRLREIFGKGHHSCPLTEAELDQYLGKPEALANRVYGPDTRVGRSLGNTEPDDGWRFRGAGLMQITGRGTYRKIGVRLGIPLEDNPELAAGAAALEIAAMDWSDEKCNDPADKNDLRGVTKRINGGYNGLVQRERYFKAAWEVYGDHPAVADRATATRADLPKSRTIKAADAIKAIGGTAAVAGGASEAGDAGVFEPIKGIADTISGFRGTLDPIIDTTRWMFSHWWIALMVAGFLLWGLAHHITVCRVEDHRTGKR